jgi:nucleotide-binding universal stress UspA family protein
VEKELLYLVPVDFTPVSISSTKFAAQLSTKNDQVLLIHVVKSEDDRTAAALKLTDFAKTHLAGFENYSIRVIKGVVSTGIAMIAETLNASLIVLGTHGASGLRKLFGSYAFKIVENSKVPLIIVQEETVFHKIKKIVMTIDLQKESLQIVRSAARLSQLFDAELILVGARQEDTVFRRKMDINMTVVASFLEDHNIPFSVEFVEEKGFEENIFKLCQDKNADMLAATYYENSFHVFTDSFVRGLANNNLGIPVLTIESENTSFGGQYSFL